MIDFAYVDPGLGLLIWQTVVAAFVGFLFYVKKTRSWILSVFRKIFRIKPKKDINPGAAESAANVETGS